MAKEFNIELEYAENGVIVRQEYEDGAPLVELVGGRLQGTNRQVRAHIVGGVRRYVFE